MHLAPSSLTIFLSGRGLLSMKNLSCCSSVNESVFELAQCGVNYEGVLKRGELLTLGVQWNAVWK